MRAVDDAAHDVGSLIIHLPDVRQQAWPWRDAWTAVLVLTSKLHDGAGSNFRPTGLGAIMRVRASLLGLGSEEYNGREQQRAELAISAVAEVWRADEDGAAMVQQMIEAMEKMTTAVESVDSDMRQSQFHKGVGGKWGQSQPNRRVSRSEGPEQRHKSEGSQLEGKGGGVKECSGLCAPIDVSNHGTVRPANAVPGEKVEDRRPQSIL